MMHVSYRRLYLVCLVATVAVTIAASPLRAEEYKVLESGAYDIKVGTTISPDDYLKIPSGAEVRLQKLPGGSTHRIVGPYEGSIAAYQTCGGMKRMLGLCPAPEEKPVGGTRGVPRH